MESGVEASKQAQGQTDTHKRGENKIPHENDFNPFFPFFFFLFYHFLSVSQIFYKCVPLKTKFTNDSVRDFR